MTYCFPFHAPQILPLHSRHEPVAADLVGNVIERDQKVLGHELHRDRGFHADEGWRTARRQVGHELHVDAVPGDRLDLELQAWRIFLRPLVHCGHRNAAIGSRFAPYPHRAGLARLGDRRMACESSEGRGGSTTQELSPPDHCVVISPY